MLLSIMYVNSFFKIVNFITLSVSSYNWKKSTFLMRFHRRNRNRRFVQNNSCGFFGFYKPQLNRRSVYIMLYRVNKSSRN